MAIPFNPLSDPTLADAGLPPLVDPALQAMVAPPMQPEQPVYTDEFLLQVFERYKKECMEHRWIYEREWVRDLNYIANRQWITYHPTRREWVDKRMAKWIPRPVTNKIAEILQSIRTNFAAVTLAIKARPLGTDTESIATAEIVEQIAPLMHEEHQMNQVMREADFWFIACGNAVLQTTWERDKRFNRVFVQSEECQLCTKRFSPKQILDNQNVCPNCGGQAFLPALDAKGEPEGSWFAYGRGKTMALSPFEYAFPAHVTRWDELPYIIRLRFRDKGWFEANKPEMVPHMVWEKTPTDRSLQIFKALAVQNDVGSGSNFASLGMAGNDFVEGVTEYELWIKPNNDFPQGYVMRILGEKSPMVLHCEDTESIPGPIPYTDIAGNPVFPFVHAQYEHMGGRLYGRSAVSPLIQKQDQLNQIDSLTQLSYQRMANPVWVVPEGAGIDHFTGEPGLILKWNPLLAGGSGNAKPERVPGADVPSGVFNLREQILQDMEELSGAFDIIKGQKPSGVEAFSAMQLLVERSQSRFTSAFQSRGEMYRKWCEIALELERKFGPEQRTKAVTVNNKGYTFKHFENAQLQGQITILIEDGSNTPKTPLGKRAAVEHANNLKLLNPNDPEQRYQLLSTFGLGDLIPSLNYHINTSATIQDAFERWAVNPMGPMPLVHKPWYNPHIHWNERIKWLNGDKMRELLTQNPLLEQYIQYHLAELQMFMSITDPTTGMPLVPMGGPGGPGNPGGGPQPQGSGMAMANANQNAGGLTGPPLETAR